MVYRVGLTAGPPRPRTARAPRGPPAPAARSRAARRPDALRDRRGSGGTEVGHSSIGVGEHLRQASAARGAAGMLELRSSLRWHARARSRPMKLAERGARCHPHQSCCAASCQLCDQLGSVFLEHFDAAGTALARQEDGRPGLGLLQAPVNAEEIPRVASGQMGRRTAPLTSWRRARKRCQHAQKPASEGSHGK